MFCHPFEEHAQSIWIKDRGENKSIFETTTQMSWVWPQGWQLPTRMTFFVRNPNQNLHLWLASWEKKVATKKSTQSSPDPLRKKQKSPNFSEMNSRQISTAQPKIAVENKTQYTPED